VLKIHLGESRDGDGHQGCVSMVAARDSLSTQNWIAGNDVAVELDSNNNEMCHYHVRKSMDDYIAIMGGCFASYGDGNVKNNVEKSIKRIISYNPRKKVINIPVRVIESFVMILVRFSPVCKHKTMHPPTWIINLASEAITFTMESFLFAAKLSSTVESSI
jgi:hypothetical protein